MKDNFTAALLFIIIIVLIFIQYFQMRMVLTVVGTGDLAVNKVLDMVAFNQPQQQITNIPTPKKHKTSEE